MNYTSHKMLSTLAAVLTVVLSSAGASAMTVDEAAKTIAADLARGVAKVGQPGPVMVSPFSGADEGPAQAFFDAVMRELVNTHHVGIVDRSSMKAALEEAAIEMSSGEGAMRDIAGGFGAKALITGDVINHGSAFTCNARVITVEDGNVLLASKADFGASSEAAENESASLHTQLRRLTDRTAQGIDKLDGDARYQRFAVLTFEEIGPTTAEKQLGLLVSAELTTLLRRDHNLMMVERAELGRIIGELALGQTGMIDPASTVEVGKLAGAQALVIGTVAEAGDRYLVNAKVVSVATGEVIVAEQAHLPAADLVALSSEAVVLRTAGGAVYRSVLMPGWGQLYNRQPIKAAAFVGTEVLALALAATYQVMGDSRVSEYEKLGVGTDAAAFQGAREDAESKFAMRNLFGWAAVAIHAANILDAVINGRSFDTASVGVGGDAASGVWRW